MEERLQQAPCGLLTMDQNGVILEVNDRYLEWLGYAEHEVVGKNIETFLTRVNRMFIHSYFFPTIQKYGHVDELYINLIHSTGDSIPFLMNARQYTRNGSISIDCMCIQIKQRIDYEMELRTLQQTTESAYKEREEAFRDLEKLYVEIERKQREIIDMNEVLYQLSNTDKLTSLPNRRYFEHELERFIEEFKMKGTVFSLVMIDIDHFKQINDTYGHSAGDRVLIQLAQVLTKEVRPMDHVARLGGEEFVILFPDTNAYEALRLAMSLTRTIASEKWDIVNELTVSMGVATFAEGETEQSVMDDADRALYRAKAKGRNCALHSKDVL